MFIKRPWLWSPRGSACFQLKTSDMGIQRIMNSPPQSLLAKPSGVPGGSRTRFLSDRKHHWGGATWLGGQRIKGTQQSQGEKFPSWEFRCALLRGGKSARRRGLWPGADVGRSRQKPAPPGGISECDFCKLKQICTCCISEPCSAKVQGRTEGVSLRCVPATATPGLTLVQLWDGRMPLTSMEFPPHSSGCHHVQGQWACRESSFLLGTTNTDL